MLAPLLEQVLRQPAITYLSLVAVEDVATAEKTRDLVANAVALQGRAWIAHVTNSSVQASFQPGGQGRGSYR
jgi:hypothetical protein